MFYIIYKITNKLDNKIYIGSHKTNNINDEYMGSGKYLNSAINKHGIENFIKEVLFVFDTPEEMYAKEAELVNEEFLLNENTYNLKQGGFGGFDFINKKKLNYSHVKNRQISPFVNPDRYNEEWHYNTHERRKKGIKKAWEENRMHKFNADINVEMRKRAETIEAKAKRKDTYKQIGHQQGEKNSQFGTMWITNGVENLKIRKEELDNYLIRGYNKGRTVRKD